MTDTRRIRERFERNARAVELRPKVGRYTSRARVRLRDGLTCDIEDGDSRLVADMSESAGGDGLGPTPGTYGRAALGSCLAIAIAQWAAKLEIGVERLEVEIETDADAAGAYGLADVPPGYTQVRCIVTIESSAPHEQVRHLLDTATARCLYWDVFARPIDVRREDRILSKEG